MSDYKYNPWPLGKLPKEFQRPEPEQIRALGYKWDDPRDINEIFESKISKFTGSKYCVLTDSCTHALELSFRYAMKTYGLDANSDISIPNHTYVSAALVPISLGLNIYFVDREWSGIYQFAGTNIYDGAVRWTKDMYVGNNALQCVSFQLKKRIPIGRGGAILCNSREEYDWFRLAVYDGRDLKTPYTDPNHIKMAGWHYYMIPEDAARGILLMDQVPEVNEDTGNSTMYPDVQKMLNL